MIRSCGFTKKRRKSMTLQIKASTMQTGRRHLVESNSFRRKWGSTCFLASMLARLWDFLRQLFTCLFFSGWKRPILFVQPTLYLSRRVHHLKIQSPTKPNLIGSVQPLAFWHKPQSRIFWSLWKCRRSLPNHSIHMSALVPVLFLSEIREEKRKEGKKII